MGEIVVYAIGVTISPVPVAAPHCRTDGQARDRERCILPRRLGTRGLLRRHAVRDPRGSGRNQRCGSTLDRDTGDRARPGFRRCGLDVVGPKTEPSRARSAVAGCSRHTDPVTLRRARTPSLRSQPESGRARSRGRARLAETNASSATTVKALLLFTAIGVVGVALPLALRALFPSRAARLLARLRTWLGKHETAILVPLGLVIGAVFLQGGVATL
jgi:hypothetical protein